MRHNRELRDQQLAEAARQSELARRAHDRALGEHARQEYMERLAREREAAAENEAARFLNYRAAANCDAGLAYGSEANAAKLLAAKKAHGIA